MLSQKSEQGYVTPLRVTLSHTFADHDGELLKRFTCGACRMPAAVLPRTDSIQLDADALRKLDLRETEALPQITYLSRGHEVQGLVPHGLAFSSSILDGS